VVAFTGIDDPVASVDEVAAWAGHTTAGFELVPLAGGHMSEALAVEGAFGNRLVELREIKATDDPEAVWRLKIKEYRSELMHRAAERGLVDDVIEPAETRSLLIRSLAMLRTKHADIPARKHGNPPV
jgi:acetyl-CoA carboxylase carboxyltransferase component